MTTIKMWVLLAALCLLMWGCSGPDNAAEAALGSRASERAVATVETLRVERGSVEETVETFGSVEFDPDETRTVSFVRSGQVARVFVTAGQAIAGGDVLLSLGPLPSSSLEVELARIDLRHARQESERLERLRDSRLATNEVVQLASRRLASARATLEGLGIDGNGRPKAITAPFAGVVVKVLATAGALVHPGEDALLVAPARGFAVRAGFEPEDAIRLRSGMPVDILPVFEAGGAEVDRAALARLHHVVDPRTQLVEALIRTVKPPRWMLAGARVRVRVIVRSATGALRAPREALLDRNGETGVFVVEKDTARWQVVHVGIQDDQWAEIRDGLEEGAIIVTTGRTSLSDGMAVTTISARGE